jgi:hypothetical protein
MVELVGNQEWMGMNTAPRRGQHVEIPSKLEDIPGGGPPRELSADIARVPVPSQEQTASKERQLTYRLQEFFKSHRIKMPLMAN